MVMRTLDEGKKYGRMFRKYSGNSRPSPPPAAA
jgi:hypothetical protein